VPGPVFIYLLALPKGRDYAFVQDLDLLALPKGKDYAFVQDLDLGIKFWVIHWSMWR
jgi:hypothetical protein